MAGSRQPVLHPGSRSIVIPAGRWLHHGGHAKCLTDHFFWSVTHNVISFWNDSHLAGVLTQLGYFSAVLPVGNGAGAHWAETRNCKNKPSVDAAADLITLNQKVQVGRLSGHQAFRTKANMHNSIQICRPEVKN